MALPEPAPDSSFDDPNPLANLGTPAEMRSVNPVTAEDEALRAEDIPKAPIEPKRERRHGIAGLRDSVAYVFQWTTLSVWGTAELTRDKDPIEQLKRRFGRKPRKY
ncbi:MAG: hypothetical protein Q8L05_06940 [Actinomycetota bacterium]|nr:hypothetical protein [Actinomycetota bacterium]MDP2289236.1 hypothetical protein [Actinomycetota bacterium]